jgi:RNA polymerase sigma-70 factor (ECF subfamily)
MNNVPLPQATFEDVYRTHFRLVRRRLARLRVREADLMDVTQDVFVVVHRQLPGFEGRSNITTWLLAICNFVALDYVRSGRFRREVVVDPGEVDRSPRTDQACHGFRSPEFAHAVTSTLSRITEKLRIVFVLSAADGLSGEEIAGTLNIPVGTVRSRLRLARKALERTNGARERSRRDSACARPH